MESKILDGLTISQPVDLQLTEIQLSRSGGNALKSPLPT